MDIKLHEGGTLKSGHICEARQNERLMRAILRGYRGVHHLTLPNARLRVRRGEGGQISGGFCLVDRAPPYSRKNSFFEIF